MNRKHVAIISAILIVAFIFSAGITIYYQDNNKTYLYASFGSGSEEITYKAFGNRTVSVESSFYTKKLHGANFYDMENSTSVLYGIYRKLEKNLSYVEGLFFKNNSGRLIMTFVDAIHLDGKFVRYEEFTILYQNNSYEHIYIYLDHAFSMYFGDVSLIVPYYININHPSIYDVIGDFQ